LIWSLDHRANEAISHLTGDKVGSPVFLQLCLQSRLVRFLHRSQFIFVSLRFGLTCSRCCLGHNGTSDESPRLAGRTSPIFLADSLDYQFKLILTFLFPRFGKAYEFNQDISSWDVRKATDFGWMFCYGALLKKTCSNFLMAHVAHLRFYFTAYKYNQSIIGWQMNSCLTVEKMFGYHKIFNRPVRSDYLSLLRLSYASS
jgi:Mycoplasma protein of unknown function, DUF285